MVAIAGLRAPHGVCGAGTDLSQRPTRRTGSEVNTILNSTMIHESNKVYTLQNGSVPRHDKRDTHDTHGTHDQHGLTCPENPLKKEK